MQVNYLEYLNEIKVNRSPCIICGKPAETLHHKDENQNNNQKENLLEVCQKCHLLIKHKKKVSEYKSIPKFKKPMQMKICPQCHKKFPHRSNKIFCSSYCRFKTWSKVHPRLKIITIIILFFLFIPSCQPAFAQNLKASFYTVQSLKKDGQWKLTKGVMANGELFKDEGFTAASWDFPLNSMVEITNLKNPSKKIVVKITDKTNRRFKGKRIDLSRRAFGELTNNQWALGLIEVSVKRIK